MNAMGLTLRQWQGYIEQFRRDNADAKPRAAFRIDGTSFSTARFYGGFHLDGDTYTVFGYNWQGEDAGALIGVRADFLRWVSRRLKEAK